MKMKMKVALILSAICIILSACQQQVPVEDQMQAVLDQAIAKYEINGISAAVVFSDGEVWIGVSGISHGTVPIDPEMYFAIGSITKNFIAALTLTLVEDGTLSLDDTIADWLPGYAHVDGKITIRQLLNHTSGIYNFFESQEVWDALKDDRSRYWTPEEVLAEIQEPYFEAGEGWQYSNTNYLLLAMIINQAAGTDLSTALQERLYQPLGLSDFYLSQEENLPENQVHVYGDNFDPGSGIRDITDEPRTSHESMIYGSGGIFTTAESLARWSQALFGGRVLEEGAMDEMLDFVEFTPVSNMNAYGLGVQEFRKKITYGQYAIGHGGGNIGTTSYMVYLPEHQVSIVVMINAFPTEASEEIVRGLTKAALNELGVPGIVSFGEANWQFLLIGVVAVGFWAYRIPKEIRKKRSQA